MENHERILGNLPLMWERLVVVFWNTALARYGVLGVKWSEKPSETSCHL